MARHLRSSRPPLPALQLVTLLLLLIVGASAAAAAAADAAFVAGGRFGVARCARRYRSATVKAADEQSEQQQQCEQQQERPWRLRPAHAQQAPLGLLASRGAHLGSLLSMVTGAAVLGARPGASRAAGVDEYEVTFEGGQGLGLAIEDFGKGGKYRTYVSRVIKGSQAERSKIRIPALVVAVNGRNVEGLPKKYVVQLLKEAQQQGGPIVITFRDPAKCVKN